MISRAQRCLLGQLACDALGSLVESRMRSGAAILMASGSWRMVAHGTPLPGSRRMIRKWRFCWPGF